MEELHVLSLKANTLAGITGISVKFISDVERGKETTQMDKVFDLVRALGIQIHLTIDPFLPEDKGSTPPTLKG